jgi:hypothetical protein
MGKKNRKTNRVTKPSRVSSKKKSFPFIIKKFISKDFITLLGIVVSLVATLIITYWTSLEPDIRAASSKELNFTISEPLIDEDGICNYHISFVLPFKNLSYKSGYVDKVSFTNESLDTVVKFELIDVNRDSIGWLEEKEIEVKFDVIGDIRLNGAKELFYNIKFYDNKGNIINKDIKGNHFYFSKGLGIVE